MLEKIKHKLFGKPKKEPFKATLPNQRKKDGELEVDSETWAFMEAWLSTKLDKLRKMNDNVKADMNTTSALRGQVTLAKEILALPATIERKEKRKGFLDR